MTEIQLKNHCPFCGNIGKIVAIGGKPTCGERPYYTPQCETYDCLLDIVEGWYDTPEEAAEAWDRRVSPWRTDLPPKDGTPIVAEFDFGMVTKVHYDFEGWQMAGAPIMFKQDPIRWMEVPE